MQSIITRNIETAEEVAIAMAIAHTNASCVISDSQTAIRNYASGRISLEALRILSTSNIREADEYVHFLWFLAHTPQCNAEDSSNEVTHNVARALTFRVTSDEAATLTDFYAPVWEWDDRLAKFN